jgi:hypothetical protein
MPAKHPPLPGTLAFYAECGRPVFIVCLNCWRFTVPKWHEIASEAGWRTNVKEIGPRMFCDVCKHRGAYFTLNRPVGRVS